MLSNNPKAGIIPVEKSNTLDCNGGAPTSQQGGVCIVQPVICLNGPAVDMVTLNVLAAADDVLIPIRPDEFSFSGLLDLVEQVQAVQESVNPGLTLRGAFFTHWQNREPFVLARQSLEDSGICPVFQTAINYNPRVPESTLEETPLCVFAPRSWAAIQYKKLTAEYLALTDSDKGKEG